MGLAHHIAQDLFLDHYKVFHKLTLLMLLYLGTNLEIYMNYYIKYYIKRVTGRPFTKKKEAEQKCGLHQHFKHKVASS